MAYRPVRRIGRAADSCEKRTKEYDERIYGERENPMILETRIAEALMAKGIYFNTYQTIGGLTHSVDNKVVYDAILEYFAEVGDEGIVKDAWTAITSSDEFIDTFMRGRPDFEALRIKAYREIESAIALSRAASMKGGQS